jgi:hypothetical protein
LSLHEAGLVVTRAVLDRNADGAVRGADSVARSIAGTWRVYGDRLFRDGGFHRSGPSAFLHHRYPSSVYIIENTSVLVRVGGFR